MLSATHVAQQITAHALVGGVAASLNGGKFGHGFFSAGVTKGLGGALLPGGSDLSSGEVIGGTVISAVIGGTASVISGGKFANGAQTGAFQFLFNQASKLDFDKIGKKVVDFLGLKSYTDIAEILAVSQDNLMKIKTMSLEELEQHFPGSKKYRLLSIARTQAYIEYNNKVHLKLQQEGLQAMLHSAIGDVYGGNVWDNFSAVQKYFIVQSYNNMGPQMSMTSQQVADYFNDGG